MTLLAFLNSGFGLLILSTIFTIIGVVIKLIYNYLHKLDKKNEDLDKKTSELEFQIRDIQNVKGSISNIGQRTGNLESDFKVLESNQQTIMDHLTDLKSDKKESGQLMSEMMNSINSLKTSIAVILEKLTKS